MNQRGLHIPQDPGMSDSAVNASANFWNTIDTANMMLQRWGIHPNNEPEITCPVITAELLLTPDTREFTTLFAAQLRWYNYATRLHADIRAAVLQVKNQMEDIAAQKREILRNANKVATKDDKLSATQMADNIEADPHYREVKQQHQGLEQLRIKLDAWVEELDRNLKTVSRQIENRKMEAESGNRASNMPAHANGRWDESHRR